MAETSSGSLRSSIRSTSVSLVARLPGAREVIVTGDFTAWSKDGIRMRKVKADEWRAEMVLAPGQYQYRLLVDGQWRDHAEAAQWAANPFGSKNGVLHVPKF